MKLVGRVAKLLHRRRAAARLGLRYPRDARFTLPQEVRIDGRWIRLNIPPDPDQRAAFVELLLDDCYNLHRIARIAKIETVLDIGANVGLFALATRIVFPTARIHVYEPNAKLQPSLAHQAMVLDFTYFLEAIGKDNATVSLLIDPRFSVLTATRLDPNGTVRQIAFCDALYRLGGRADLVKMDCEGAEWEILADSNSWKAVRYVTMEYHLSNRATRNDCLSGLNKLGFSIISHQGMPWGGLVTAGRN